MKKGLFLQRILVAAFAVMLITSTGIGEIFAGNSSDTGFSFNFNTSSIKYTETRLKMDDTNCYMVAKSANANFYAKAYGINKSGVWADMSGGYEYLMTTGKETFLRNWIYENGQVYTGGSRKGRIQARPGINLIASGLWSPDSV